MLVYIACPMTKGHRIHNMRNAIDAAEAIAKTGNTPYIPNLNDMWELVYPNHDYEFWLKMDFEVIERCHVLVRLPGESPGADREVKFAQELQMPVFFGLEEFHNYIKEEEDRLP